MEKYTHHALLKICLQIFANYKQSSDPAESPFGTK